MKLGSRRLLLATGFVGTLTVAFGAPSPAVHFAIGDWEPLTSSTHAEKRTLERVVREAYALMGVKVEFSYYPWTRSALMVERGEADGTFPWNLTPDRRARFVAHKTSLLTSPSVFFHIKGTSFDWQTLEDLKKYRVGVTQGYKEESLYRDLGIAAEVVASEESNFHKLLLGRIDVYMTTQIVGYEMIANLFPPDERARFTHHPKVASTSEFFVLFSKQRPSSVEYARLLDEGLRKLHASGAYRRIMAEHGIGLPK